MSDDQSDSPPGTGATQSPPAGPVNTAAPLIPKVPPPAPRKPQIGDSMAAGPPSEAPTGEADGSGSNSSGAARRRRRRGRGGGGGGAGAQNGGSEGSGGGENGAGQNPVPQTSGQNGQQGTQGTGARSQSKKPAASNRSAPQPIEAVLTDDEGPVHLDAKMTKKRSGRQRKGKATGRYQMNVHVDVDGNTHIAVLEGRSLTEHYVSRPADDVSQIHGNIYAGRVENVLPGMEAAFIDIATPKNAVLYAGDIQYDREDLDRGGERPRIENVLKNGQLLLSQVTKNPIGHKGARLTQEVSLPGRFVVLVPNSSTYGISKRLPDGERKRLRQLLDRVKPAEHGVIVRTAAENVTTEELERDVARLVGQWEQITQLFAQQNRPGLLYREPDMAVRVIREEFNTEYRAVIIDEPKLFADVHDYVSAISPTLGDRVQLYDRTVEPLPLFERYQITEQLRKGLDRKVWLPSGGSLIIEHTEALTVIDVNTGRNVGSSSLEETVFRNNLEAAVEIARQLRLRDIGGIIVVDFIDMEIKPNRDELVRVFKDALARDKTRTQVFSVSELGLVEMTRKRIGEGLLESFADQCEACAGRGVVLSSGIAGID